MRHLADLTVFHAFLKFLRQVVLHFLELWMHAELIVIVHRKTYIIVNGLIKMNHMRRIELCFGVELTSLLICSLGCRFVNKSWSLWVLLWAFDGDIVDLDSIDSSWLFCRWSLLYIMDMRMVNCANLWTLLDLYVQIWILLVQFCVLGSQNCERSILFIRREIGVILWLIICLCSIDGQVLFSVFDLPLVKVGLVECFRKNVILYCAFLPDSWIGRNLLLFFITFFLML